MTFYNRFRFMLLDVSGTVGRIVVFIMLVVAAGILAVGFMVYMVKGANASSYMPSIEIEQTIKRREFIADMSPACGQAVRNGLGFYGTDLALILQEDQLQELWRKIPCIFFLDADFFIQETERYRNGL